MEFCFWLNRAILNTFYVRQRRCELIRRRAWKCSDKWSKFMKWNMEQEILKGFLEFLQISRSITDVNVNNSELKWIFLTILNM